VTLEAISSKHRISSGNGSRPLIWALADLIARASALVVIAVAAATPFAAIDCAAAQSPSTHDRAERSAVAFAKTRDDPANKKAAIRSKRKKDSGSVDVAKSKPGGSLATTQPVQASLPDVASRDIALVRKAIDALHKSPESATQIEAGISDPAARKLVEWIILRSGNRFRSTRYIAFISANPSWPSLSTFGRYAEEMLWVEDVKPGEVLRFFKDSPPQIARGRLALARALYAQGEIEGARAQVRNAWRNDSMPAELEQQLLNMHSELLTRDDHKARMERRLAAGDKEAAMRAAHRLGGVQVTIARARIALNEKNGSGNNLLDTVPPEARDDPGYILARVHVLRHQDKIAEAAQVLLSARFDEGQFLDPEECWVARRMLSRKLLDIGDVRSAYLIVRDAAEPVKENSRVERLFMAGWIALRYLNDAAAAAGHFARISDESTHPTSLARSHYWLGRTAEALHQPGAARAHYETAARSSAAYYGQLARARLGLNALALGPTPVSRAARGERTELMRALDILYAVNERPLTISFMADLGNKVRDVGMLVDLGNLAEQRQDARGMLQLGKAAVARGLPLEYHAFPTVGVPQYSAIGPRIDSALLFAIIRQESAFNPADLSAANAMGLMQVTPAAGRDTCKRFGCKYDVRRLKNDSPYNLQVGAAELGGLLEEYGGNHILAFAAYNAGRGRVQEWIKAFGDPRDEKIDPIDWVERIPFMETRNYVQRVMENMHVYRARLGTKGRLTIERDLRGKAAAAN
jgi:peptidoglycan lytic transglycosylase